MLRSRLSLPLVVALLAAAAVPAALEAHTTSAAGTISVTAGVPRELSFTLSRSRITSSTAVFRVKNKGKLRHSFKVCMQPSPNDKANSCTGLATKMLAPGAAATLTVKLFASGTYEYLSGSAAQAKSGMKGLLTVSLPAATSSSGSGTDTGSMTTTPKSSGGGGSGGVVNGAATDPACPPGTTVPVGPNTGDQDDDNEGGFPTDGDGCV
jgi:uncharacterized cupredoxin-like copper-binding protein